MKLKCIGGECDGNICEIDVNQWGDGKWHRGDAFKVCKPLKYLSVDNLDWTNPPSEANITFYVYIISVFNFSKDDVYFFLRPQGWTDKDAIKYQFRK